ncbi:MAG: GNAT family N-acetyltransferase [Candidatus Eremiobacteraeota bacterium]|nr:GNAT family N-acetyltransferase [Candidatus Eremiobacteraeota bacterium]MCW5868647.1 GNAT family N-acetyltransferase [Candidatus Eremiobacteraeota bacterium]
MSRADPRETIEDLRRLRFPEAVAVFLAGSVMRGQATEHSDLDVVVVHSSLPSAYRESLLHRDWPVELFVHDPETLAHFFESGRQSGVPSLAAMVAEGLELPEPTERSRHWKEQARELLRQGPPAWDSRQLQAARYAITDVCDDLRSPRGPEQAMASACRLYELLANFALRANGRWSATGKSLPGQLELLEPGLASLFTDAFAQVFREQNPQALLELTDRLLDPFGGRLFCEPPRPAPASWRLRTPPRLETERLVLRMGEECDIPAILRYVRQNQARLAPLEPERPLDFYTPGYWQDYLARARVEFTQETALRLLLHPRQSQEVIGIINFSQIFRGPFQACYLGYSLDSRWEGKGIMFEALQCALDFVFNQLGLHRVMANYVTDNERSGRLLERLGFRIEGRAPDYLQIGGQWREHVLTALTRPE